jgi:4-hydroxy-4-methyl-2-oxoglutarate aldolase
MVPSSSPCLPHRKQLEMPEPVILSSDELEALRRIDSATIANAIEPFGVRPLTEGFTGMDIKCMFPELGVMVGYAVTAMVDSQTEGPKPDRSVLWQVIKAIDASPKPAVLVYQDAGPRPSHSCHFGDALANLAKRVGAEGLITNGGVRDLPGVREIGFRYFAPGVTVSHGNYRYVSAGEPVEVSGLRVEQGNLIHADENGVVLIPNEIARDVVESARRILETEASTIGYYRGADFTIEGVAQRLGVNPNS